MITLYHCINARSFRALWMLEELKIPYELKMLPFPPRIAAKWYLDINPLGTIPLLINGPTRMTESAAICQYLCSLKVYTPLQVEPSEDTYGAYLNYLHFGEATLTFPQSLALRYGRFEPENRRLPSVAEDYSKWFLARLRTLEPLLSGQPFLCGDRFTAADVSVGYSLLLAQHIGLSSRFTPAVATYWQHLQERESYIQGMNAQVAAALEQGVSTLPAPDSLPLTDLPPTAIPISCREVQGVVG